MDYQRAQRSKGRKRIESYRNSRRVGSKKHLKIHKDPDWYVEYLKSEHWQEFKIKYASSKQPQKCVVCNNPNYELHHRTYDRIWNEYLTDVVALCRGHHAKVHKLMKQGLDVESATKKVISGV